MSQLAIQRLISGGVITNYHCVSRCGHCLYNCGPHRPKDYLEVPLANHIFERIAALGCRSVHIGGGEPMLNPKKLLAVLAAARGVGVDIDYLETNSAWFADLGQASELLAKLQAAGVHTLLVSISPFHNAHIPYARVKGVIEACRRSGMAVFPWVNDFVGDLTQLDQDTAHCMAEFETALGPDYLKHIPDRYWIHLGGRALDTFRSVSTLYSLEHILANSPSSCASALGDTGHFHIDLYANYIPGLCSGLAIALEDLGRQLTAGSYVLLDRLVAEGIRGLYEMARQDFGYAPQHRGFLNHCDLCTDIRSFLLRQDSQQFKELAPEAHYDQAEPPKLALLEPQRS